MITSLSLKNFRGQRSTTLTFGPGLNRLTGPNEAGKTTIGHAIAFSFYGVDLSGSNRDTDSLITQGTDVTEVTLTTEKAKFHRTKERGKTAKIKFARAKLPFDDADQTGLSRMLGMTPTTFLSLVNVGHFMRLDDARKLEVLGAVARLDRKELLTSLLSPEFATKPTTLKLENLRSDLSQVTIERRKLNNQVNSDQGALEQIDRFLAEMSKSEGINPAQLSAEIEQLQAQKALHQLYRNDLQAYKIALARAQDLQKSNDMKRAGQEKALIEQKALGPEPSQTYLEELRQKNAKLIRERDALYDSKKPLPEEPHLPELTHEETCLRCGRVVTEKMRQNVVQERENVINLYNKRAREIADHNREVDQKVVQYGKEILATGDELRSLELQAEVWKTKSNSIKTRLEQAVLSEVSFPEAPLAPEGSLDKIEILLQDLIGKKYTSEHAAQKKASYEVQKRAFQESVAQKAKELEFLESLENALHELPALETKTLLERIKTEGVVFSLLDGTLTVTSDSGMPYHLLSTGRRMRVDFAIAKTLQSLLPKGKAPGFYFFDDYDLLDAAIQQEIPKEAQVFIAQVTSKATQLEVITA